MISLGVMVSIIVPAFNAIAYLEDCIMSIVCGIYRSFEIILIDDGSTDGTGELCDALQRSHGEIRVFHTENRGLPSARNLGIEKASGQYIGFVDADDQVLPAMFDALVGAMNPDVQLAACRFQRCARNSVVPSADKAPLRHEVTNQLGAAEHMVRGAYGLYVWNKLYRKDILDANGIRFLPDAQGAEDDFFNAAYLRYCTKAVFLNQKLYRYITTDGSITSAFRSNRIVSSCYVSIPRSWRYTAEVMAEISADLRIWAQACTAMFYQTVLRKLEQPDEEFIREAVDYVRANKSALRRYRWGWKYYLSALCLSISYPLWAKIFRRGLAA